MEHELFKVMKAKLARGGQMNGGEIKLIVIDLICHTRTVLLKPVKIDQPSPLQ